MEFCIWTLTKLPRGHDGFRALHGPPKQFQKSGTIAI